MGNLNKVILMGNLGQEPRYRKTPSGASVLSWRMATTAHWKDKDQKTQERTDWHNVSIFGPQCEHLRNLLTKGSGVAVEGQLRTSDYEKDGVKRWFTEVVASNVQLMGGRGRMGQARNGTAPDINGNQAELATGIEDDVPF